METFSNFELNQSLVESLNGNDFINPTPIQSEAIPLILEGSDLFAQAKTGSGKTGAFVIPIIQKILFETNVEDTKLSYVVLSPTRELAQQTYSVAKTFGETLGLKSACFIGGEDIKNQKKELEAGVHLIIATPGRLIDLYKQKLVSFNKVLGVVLDEADRLFDMGFKDDIFYLISKTPKGRQLLMFSATNNLDVLNTAYKFNAHPKEIKVNVKEIIVSEINHSLIHVGANEKVPLLVGILSELPEAYGIIFCNTKSETHTLAKWLSNQNLNHKVKAISGSLPQAKRTKLMREFRDKDLNILISTDVAARGLDIDNVNIVINYDLPQDAANYVHRVGRTGRAGKDGRAISFCAYEDCQYLDAIEKYIKGKIPTEDINEEMLSIDVGPRPKSENKRSDSMENEKRNQKQQRNNRNERSTHGRNKRHGQDRKNNKKNVRKSDSSRHHNRPRNNNRNDRDQNRDRKNNPPKMRYHFVTSNDFNAALSEAKEKLGVNDTNFIGHTIVEKGKKSFFGIFGKRECKYKFFIDPKYDVIAREYLDHIVKLLNLDISYGFEKEGHRLIIDFVGGDEDLFTDNNFEFLQSIEHLLKKHIGKKLKLSSDISIQLTCNGHGNDKEREIENLAREMSEKALRDKKPVLLNSMSPKDRRIVHQALNGNPKVKTKSVGDGHYKRVQITPV